MMQKVCILVLLAVTAASVAAVPAVSHDDYGPVEYRFKYSVHDDHTGDIKHQHEERLGDKVTGQYSLIDADGYRRIVDYSSDKHTGFVADVHRELIKGFRVATSPKKTAAIPVVKLSKTFTLAPPEYHIDPVHIVEQNHYVKVHQAVPQIHASRPVVHLSKNGNDVHSHTSFKSGNVSYQY